MRLSIRAIGRLRRGPEADLVEAYAGRIRAIGPRIGYTAFDIDEYESPKSNDAVRRQAREGDWLRRKSGRHPAGETFTVVLDEKGRQLTSADFARQLESWRDAGVGRVAFLIGGADGHAPETIAAAGLRLSLGAMTWPHMLARAMTCEQIYRALCIVAGHPYHRD